MEKILLPVEEREKKYKSTLKKLRKEGFIPAVLYGKNITPRYLKVEKSAFIKALGPKVEHVLLSLRLDGQEILAVLQDVQLDPLTEEIIHLDFHHVSLEEELEVEVPVSLTGRAKGEEEGGMVEFLTREVKVRCKPAQIPEHIQVDISPLKIGESFHIRDLPAQKGIRIVEEPEKTIVLIIPPKRVEKAPVVPEEKAEEVKPTVEEEKKEESKEKPKE
jgi:large subunit ribosomal protein L25